MAAVEPPPISLAPDDFEEAESSDEDSIPEEPEFEIELPWYRSIRGRDDSRTLYTRAQCVVKVRVTDTIGDLRRKVAQASRLSQFELSINGMKLLTEDPPDEGTKKGRQKSEMGGEDEDGNEFDEDEEEEEEEEEEDTDGEDEDEMRQMAIMMAVGDEKVRLEAEEAERQRLKLGKDTQPQFDARTLLSMGVKEPPKPKTKAELEAELVKKAMAAEAAKEEAAAAADNGGGGGDADASFVPREPPPTAAGAAAGAAAATPNGEDGAAAAAAAAGGGGGGAAAGGAEEENGLVEGGDGGGGDGGEAAAAAAAVAAEKDRPSAVVVVDEFDDSLDDRINQKPESSKVLLQRAIDATNLPWWERAADGNTETAKELFHKSTRKELLQVNWRNPDNHERSAVQACAFRGQRHALVWLVTEMGAKVNGTDSFGCTALNLAARGGYPKIVRFLLENRAKTETEDRNGWTAAVWALAMGHIDVLQVMADMGVPLADLGRAAPFDSAHMSPTTLLPLPCVRYKADQAAARLKSHKQELALRARAHSERQESLRQAKEEEMMGMQEKLKQVKIEQYKHRYMRDARENWSKRPLDKQKPPKNKDKDNGGSLS